MEPESQLNLPAIQLDAPQPSGLATEAEAAQQALAAFPLLAEATLPPETPVSGSFAWVFVGANGLRTGWTVIIFFLLWRYLPQFFGTLFFLAHLIAPEPSYTATDSFFRELVLFISLLGAAATAMLLQYRPRNLLAYNLIGPKRTRHFLVGMVAGFAALSLLVGALKAGGWIAIAPSGTATPLLIQDAALWGLMFLLVSFYEEGTFRCYLQAMLTRGLNLWWALGSEAAICGWLLWRGKGNGIWGVLLIALLGLGPCLWLALRKAESAGFWLAAWVASTFFGQVHTGNGGENWIGIFSAAAIGFVFAVSVRLTGSAWWAIGFHAAWDWAETYFYGTADSGMQTQGSLLISKPAGNLFWSGGTDGPEGSVLVLAVISITLGALLLAYGRGPKALEPEAQAQL
jgi:hypothetical protein